MHPILGKQAKLIYEIRNEKNNNPIFYLMDETKINCCYMVYISYPLCFVCSLGAFWCTRSFPLHTTFLCNNITTSLCKNVRFDALLIRKE